VHQNRTHTQSTFSAVKDATVVSVKSASDEPKNMVRPRRIDSLSEEERDEIVDRSSSSDVTDDVRRIVGGVRDEGDKALREFTREFDGAEVDDLRVTDDGMERGRRNCDDEVLEAIEEAHERIRDFHERQVREDWSQEDEGIEVGRRFVPLSSAGAYVPGGEASYPSTALMTVVPAKAAGVERVVACTPPPVEDATVAALDIAGADEVYRAGGAQAVAAMAYGTGTVEAVDAVVGPGNVYVTEAKRQARENGAVRIEFPAGPSEVCVIADETANPTYAAHELVAQLEHDADASALLLATDEGVAKEVAEEFEKVADATKRSETVREARCDFLAGTLDDCVQFTNDFAPEHLVVMTEDDDAVLRRIRNAGSVFLGPNTPVACGDYATGTNHVLPTAGGAHLHGGLSVDDFVKTTTYQRLSEKGLGEIGETVTTLARAEGLSAHADSVEVRRENDPD